MAVSNKESIDSVEDLEHSTITDLLSEMEKGSMQREFPIEKQAETTRQVVSLTFFLSHLYLYASVFSHLLFSTYVWQIVTFNFF